AARILDRGLQPQRVAPAVSLQAVRYKSTKLLADLGRVIDDRATTAMAWILNRCHVGFLIGAIRGGWQAFSCAGSQPYPRGGTKRKEGACGCSPGLAESWGGVIGPQSP